MPQHILLSIPHEWGYARSVLRGIYRWAKPQRDWVFSNPKKGQGVRVDYQSGHEPYHGVIALADGPLLREHAAEWSLPLVDLTGVGDIAVDAEACAELAIAYFRARGYAAIAVCDYRSGPYAAGRADAVARVAARMGVTCDRFAHGGPIPRGLSLHPNLQGHWRELQGWLASLPRPAAVIAASDETANVVCEVCRRAGYRVPEEISVLGMDDDDLYALQSFPALSSIRLPAERIGRLAARRLDRLLDGAKTGPPLRLPPLGVVERRSTQADAITDPLVTRAMALIVERAADGLGVDGILRELAVGRRQLEQRFRAELGSSPHAEIRRRRVERVRELLATTDLPLDAIAEATGFGSAARLSVSYKQLTGTSPGAWRRAVRG